MRILYIFIFFPTVIFMACHEIENPSNAVSPPKIAIDFQADSTLNDIELIVEKADSIVDTLLILHNKLIEEKGDTATTGLAYRLALVKLDSSNALFTMLKAGRVHLDSVFAINSPSRAITDTINSVFNLPLDINAESSTFVFHYLNKKDTLAFNYKIRTKASIDQINVIAYDINLTMSTFDSYSRLYCNNENCTSSEIVFKVFF